MLSHDNLTWDAVAIGAYLDIVPGWEDIVSYLPLSHVAAQVGYYLFNFIIIF
jgi:long-subunit acyl-CoA synthetase (AMP-forming)